MWRLLLLGGPSRGGCRPRPLSSSSWGSCWRCGGALIAGREQAEEELLRRCFCPACRALQPPPPAATDLFRILGCPRSFRLEGADLQRRFRGLQRRLHPDGFGQSSQAERAWAEQHSALVNRAFQTLRSPLGRGLYLLELHGVELETGADTEEDPEFLLEIMDINEKLAETDSEDTWRELEAHITVKQEQLTNDVAQAFDKGDLQKAKKVLAKMKYFANLEEKVKSKKDPFLTPR